MKIRWIAPLILCMACGGHQPAEEKKQDSVPGSDTTKVVKHIVANTPVGIAPVAKDTAAPGQPLVFTTDLNYDSIPDTISLRTLARNTLYYDSITVSIARYGKQTFGCREGWYRVDDDWSAAKENALPTSRFFLARNGVESLLLLFGWVGEDAREEFSIIRVKDNVSKMVFDQRRWNDNIEVVNFVKDMDGDGRFEFGYGHLTEGENTNSEEIGGILTAYSPTMVYTVDDSLVLNKPMMKKWNQENYVFAGYAYTDAVKVFWPNDRTKKCRLWKK